MSDFITGLDEYEKKATEQEMLEKHLPDYLTSAANYRMAEVNSVGKTIFIGEAFRLKYKFKVKHECVIVAKSIIHRAFYVAYQDKLRKLFCNQCGDLINYNNGLLHRHG